MTAGDLHLIFLALSGVALLGAVIGNALGFFRLSPSVWPVGQAIIRLGMSTAGAACIASVMASWLTGATWRERIFWELAADGGFALLAVGLLVGAVERDLLRRASRQRARERYAESQSD